MPPDPTRHPTADDLGRCLRGELPEAAAARVAAHVDACPDCQAALEKVSRPAPPPLGLPPEIPGFTVLGDDPIGVGGMGEVFRAVESGIGREVAVKIVHRCHAANPGRPRLVRRFVEEVKLLGRIQHAGVPPVYRFGWLDPEGKKDPYLVMRLIPWPTLAHELAADWAPGKGGPAANRLNHYLIWFGRVCEAVGYAHDHGAVHLDLKPANIKVHRSGEVQVLDWGLGRGFMPTPEGRTVVFKESSMDVDVGPVGHTAEYSPPEQVRGGHPDPKMHPRADVFALGSVLCEVLTGRPAFAGSSPEERFNKAWHGDLTDARARLGAAARRHPDLAALALRCLATDPADRPVDATAVAAEVRRIILSAEDRLRTARWRFRVWATAAAACVLAAAATGGFFVQGDVQARAAAREKVEAKARDHLDRAAEAEARMPAGDFGLPAVREAVAAVWADVAREVKAADDRISGQEVDPLLARRIRAAAERAERGYAAVKEDKALLDALDALRARKVYYPDPDIYAQFSGGYHYSRGAAEDYPRAFKEAGLDPDRHPDRMRKFVADVRARSPRVHGAVVAALDDWYLLDRTPDRRWLLELARDLDDDPVRREVRTGVRGGAETMALLMRQEPGLAARLTPGAALLAAAALEPWDPGGSAARGPDAAAALLGSVAAKLPAGAAAAYWVHLTRGFYLWHAGGARPDIAPKAVAHLRAAEAVAAGPGSADDRTPAGVLRAAAGGLRAYAEAAQSAPSGVDDAIRQGLDQYPGYWPLWQLAVLVRIDRGDAAGARAVAREWAQRHRDSVLARGYEALAGALPELGPAVAGPTIAELAGEATARGVLSAVDRLQLDELRQATEPKTRASPQDRSVGRVHPTRPGRYFVLVADARVRLDRDLDAAHRPPTPSASAAAARLGFRPWAVWSADPGGGWVGRDAGEEWATPGRAVEGYRRAVAAAPWATAPRYGMVRAQAALGRLATAADEADELAKLPADKSRIGLLHVYRARLHLAEAEWTRDPGEAALRRKRAADALAEAVRAIPDLDACAAAVWAQSEAAKLLAADPVGGAKDTPEAMCGRADRAYRQFGAGWLAARLAADPFVLRDTFAASPFTAARGVPGGDVTVARCLILAAWGCRRVPPEARHAAAARLSFFGLPPSPRLGARARIELLRRLRERLKVAADAREPLAKDVFDDPIVLGFAADIGLAVGLPSESLLAQEDAWEWDAEDGAWLELFEELKPPGVVPRWSDRRRPSRAAADGPRGEN